MILDLLACAVVFLGIASIVIGFVAAIMAGNWIAAIAIAAGVFGGWWLLRS